MKKVLILCTGNSCRSILAEALINARYEGKIKAYSAGVRANGKVNPNAKQLLCQRGIWREEYHSKTLESVMGEEFDLVVSVCDHAKESCPLFSVPIERLHQSFPDPDGEPMEVFERVYESIERELLPKIAAKLGV